MEMFVFWFSFEKVSEGSHPVSSRVHLNSYPLGLFSSVGKVLGIPGCFFVITDTKWCGKALHTLSQHRNPYATNCDHHFLKHPKMAAPKSTTWSLDKVQTFLWLVADERISEGKDIFPLFLFYVMFKTIS